MKHFADAGRVVSVLLELLGQRDRVGHGPAKMETQTVNAERRGASTGQQVISRGCTHGLIAVCPVEPNSPRCQTVEVGRMNPLVTVSAERRLEVVDQDQQDIGALGSLRRARAGDNQQAEQADQASGKSRHETLVVRRSSPDRFAPPGW